MKAMRLGQLFSNIGNGVKNFGLRIGSTFNKIAPKALHYGKMVAGGLSHLPGAIGTAAGFVRKGMDYADKVINSLPDSQFKSKLKSLESNGTELVNKVESKANNMGRTAAVIGDSAGKILNSIGKPII